MILLFCWLYPDICMGLFQPPKTESLTLRGKWGTQEINVHALLPLGDPDFISQAGRQKCLLLTSGSQIILPWT